MVRLLPEPDSPTTPSDSPSATTILTRSTARPVPVREGNVTDRFSISSRAMSALQSGIEGIAQAIAEKVEGKHCDQDHDAGERHHPPGVRYEFPGVGQHRAPFGQGRLGPKPEKSKRRCIENGGRNPERRLDDQGR